MEPEIAEDLLEQIVRLGGLEAAEALVELRRERVAPTFGARSARIARDKLKKWLATHPPEDDGRSALCEALVGGIIDAFEDFRARKLRAVVVRALPGSRVWSAGHDVGELPEGRRDPLGWDDPLRNLIRQIESFPAPVIAMIEGTVWGGASETVFACDLLLATPEATFRLSAGDVLVVVGQPQQLRGAYRLLTGAEPA